MVLITILFLRNLPYQVLLSNALCLNALRFVVLLTSLGTLFYNAGPMKDKAF